jgi:hypothetical protein
MTIVRRRPRQFDPLMTPEGVRKFLEQLRVTAPGLFPAEEESLISLLNAARYLKKRSNPATQRGRPSQWGPEVLSEAITILGKLLEQETNGRVSIQTFIGQHLGVLVYPNEIANALSNGQINKQEAASLARLTAERLQVAEKEARQLRIELLTTHLDTQGSQNQLRSKVKEVLGENAIFSRETLAVGLQKSDALLEFNRLDVKHIFFDTMRDLFYAIRTLQPEELLDEDIAEFMTAADSLSNTLKGIEQRILKRKQPPSETRDTQAATKSTQRLEIIKDPITRMVTYKFR